MYIYTKYIKIEQEQDYPMDMQNRFSQLLSELTKGLYEKDYEIALSLLSAIAGESVLLLGPPGVAKSMIARRVKCAFSDAVSFEYLMSRFSTPDDIFGPVSISKLKDSDSYERMTSGYLPEADIVFLDEIWKAGPAILNTLLTIVNEKTFRNGKSIINVPMKLLIGASNELPADGEGLEALWDRFLVRMECGCVKDEQNFYKILNEDISDSTLADADIPEDLLISNEEYGKWQQEIKKISISKDVLESISYLRQRLPKLKIVLDGDENTSRIHNVYVSDRRWKHIAHLLRTAAFVQGRNEVMPIDLSILLYCLWNEPDEIEPILTVIVNAMLNPIRKEIERLDEAISIELKNARVKQALQQAERSGDTRDENKQIFDNFYYRIDNYGTGNTYIFLVDYKHLPFFSNMNAALDGVIYPDPANPKRSIIRSLADAIGLNSNGINASRVKLYRGENDIYMNGVKYPIHLLPRGQRQAIPQISAKLKVDTDYEELVEDLSARLRSITDSISYNNLFVNKSFIKEIDNHKQDLNRRIALMRINLQKLLYDE